jgi:hypothetical protein
MSILINLAAEFTGKKAFREADSSIKGLEKSTKQLAKALGYTLSAAAITAYGKAAVKAFAEDEAATVRLTQAVNNLGYAYASSDISNFIKGLETSAGIADDTLRPAFQALLTTTKDLNSSYILLNDAIAISRGSGVELATVAQDLANGYVGVTRGLRKYNTGLTQAELKSKNFSEVLTILNSQFAGANQAYLDTYAYKLDVLTVASENAKETIGGGLIDAFARIAGGTEVKDAAKAIDNIAKSINTLVTIVSTTIGLLVKLYQALDFLTSFGGLTGANPKWMAKETDKVTKAAVTTGKVQTKTATTLTKATKANTAELKKQALAKKQSSLFDLEQIQLVAALKGQLTEEERKRVKLQLALLMENESEATKLSREIANAIDSTGALAKFLTTLPDAKNPFANWSNYVAAAAAVPMNGAGLDFGGNKIGSAVGGGFTPPATGTYGGSAPVVVQIDGKTIASALMDQSLSGNQAYVNRRTGGFE